MLTAPATANRIWKLAHKSGICPIVLRLYHSILQKSTKNLCLFLLFDDDRFMLFTRQKSLDILVMRRPSEYVEEQNKTEHKKNVTAGQAIFIAEEKDDELPNGEARNAHKRAHRSPICDGYVRDNAKDDQEPPKKIDGRFATEAKPK